MEITAAIETRRSHRYLTEPAPGDEQFAAMLASAAAAPDHGLLRPWRWILLRGQDRAALGDCLASCVPPERRRQTGAKVLRAPLMAVLVFAPHRDHKVPEWEQLAAASSMAYAMMLLLHAGGYGSIWRTGALCRSAGVPEFLGLAAHERTLGSLDIGTPDAPVPLTPKTPVDLTGRISALPTHQRGVEAHGALRS